MALTCDEIYRAKAEGDTFVSTHLPVLCEEILERQNTALLRDGYVRELARIYSVFAGHDALAVAESTIKVAAMVYVVKMEGM
jgi:hypothetical protein